MDTSAPKIVITSVLSSVYHPGTLVRVLIHARSRNLPSKLDTQYSGLCEVVEVRGALLTKRELETQRILTANHCSFRRSTIEYAAAPPVPDALAAPLPPLPRAAPPSPIRTHSRQRTRFLAPQTEPPRVEPQNREPVAPRQRAPAPPP